MQHLLAIARLSPPLPARSSGVVRARRRRDGHRRADPVPGRPSRSTTSARAAPTCGRSRRRWPRRACCASRSASRAGSWPGKVSLGVEYDLRNRMYEHLHSLELAFFDGQQTGQLMSRSTVDLQAVRFFLGYGLIFILQSALTILIAAGVMLAVDPRLAAVVARADAVRDLGGVPLRAPQPAGHPGGAAADRGADRGRRGEHLRRARGQGVRPGGAPAAPLQPLGGAGVRPVDGLHAAARLLLAVHRLPPPARPGGAPARGRPAGDQRARSASASSSPSTATC